MLTKTAQFFSLMLLSMLTTSVAIAADFSTPDNQWHVLTTQGNVYTKPAAADKNSWVAVKQDDLLIAPLHIKTGENARITLKHRNDQTTVGPNSVIEFAEEEINKTKLFSRIIQSLGQSLFKIKTSDNRKIQVETPYLVSIVKGTTFSVQVTDKRAIVNLVEGLLQVNAVGINSSVLLKTGQIAVLAAGDKTITVIDPNSTTSLPDDEDTFIVNSHINTHVTQASVHTTASAINTGSINVVASSFLVSQLPTTTITTAPLPTTSPATSPTVPRNPANSNNPANPRNNGIGIGVGGTPPGMQ